MGFKHPFYSYFNLVITRLRLILFFGWAWQMDVLISHILLLVRGSNFKSILNTVQPAAETYKLPHCNAHKPFYFYQSIFLVTLLPLYISRGNLFYSYLILHKFRVVSPSFRTVDGDILQSSNATLNPHEFVCSELRRPLRF